MVKKLGIIVQAHMGSTRLKNKMMRELHGKSVLGQVILRLKKVQLANALIIATSDLPEDDVLVAECKKYGVLVYRGSNENVLERFYGAARHYGLSDIARICADNTFNDWNIIDAEIKCYQTGMYDVVTSGKTIPLGIGCELFSFSQLDDAVQHATQHYQQEHVTPYIYENTTSVYKYEIHKDYSEYRFTLDTMEDWTLIKKIYDGLYESNPFFSLEDVIHLMESNPEWIGINKNVHQKQVRE